MGKVRTGLAVSLDGFISGPNDGPEAPMGDGGERLLGWYAGGDTEYRLPGTDMVFMVSAPTAEFLRETRETTGALVFGRRSFDLTHGWGGNHPLDVPVFVVSSSVPQEWVYEGSPFTFVTDGLQSALEQAQAVAGDKDVGVGAASIVQQCIRAGLLDEIHLDLVPVLLGGRRAIVRPPRHRADRPGAHEGDRGRWGDTSDLPRREVKYPRGRVWAAAPQALVAG
jgi:dihydrofolate reductase